MTVEALALPPEAAVRHFRRKGLHTGFDWRDTAADVHARSFTVSKAMELDVLEDIRESADSAIADGLSFQEFADGPVIGVDDAGESIRAGGLAARLQEKGWWGIKPLIDPNTGAIVQARLGSPYKLRTIFETNLRTSYAAGRWERIERLAPRLPWLRYSAVLDDRTRPEHAAWHGVILPADHPFWTTHYPPNGWGCRCLVQQLADDDLKEFGYAPADEAPPLNERRLRNRRTGEIELVPTGIDPGWQFNVGKLSAGAFNSRAFMSKLREAPRDIRQAFEN